MSLTTPLWRGIFLVIRPLGPPGHGILNILSQNGGEQAKRLAVSSWKGSVDRDGTHAVARVAQGGKILARPEFLYM